ncbi:MAG: hypothetical protein M1837_002575 [Sclerophora amabilis]|nr:MAG: hypothetical protein M1837_002575 [Sclerophora amabilis]
MPSLTGSELPSALKDPAVLDTLPLDLTETPLLTMSETTSIFSDLDNQSCSSSLEELMKTSYNTAQQASHTFSVTWVSQRVVEKERYQGALKNLSRIAPQSNVAQWAFPQWLEHRLAQLNAEKEALQRKVNTVQGMEELMPVVVTALGGKTFVESRGAVLSRETIWCKWPDDEKDKGAPWPSKEEWKWEGDDRAKTGVQRFPPIPRKPGNETVVWHMREAVAAKEFDQVRMIPTIADETEDLSTSKADEALLMLNIGSSLWSVIDD